MTSLTVTDFTVTAGDYRPRHHPTHGWREIDRRADVAHARPSIVMHKELGQPAV